MLSDQRHGTLRAMREELLSKQSSEIRGMFGRIAHRYDLLNRVLSIGRDVGWRKTVARRVAAANPGRVLDVCTGTGDLALAVVGDVIVGADFCLPMLALARSKGRGRGRDVPFCAADALQLPFADMSVDVVTVAFGIRNFSDLETGLAELVRVLRPGGLMLVLEFSRPRGPLAPLLRWWVRTVPPRVGRALSGDPEAYTYLPQSVSAFAEGDVLCSALRKAGLDGVEVQQLTSGVASLYEGTRRTAARWREGVS
jgi:demethylmenaquinone methyltransferase / 2-methoxy-6-polyprenyl-1,4-benzoquinol methylase